jgi:aspartate racemase
MKKIGLLGGVSWVSTVDYYRFINEGINEKLGGLNFAECMIYSLNFADIHDKGWNSSFELLLYACKSLKNSGAEAIVLCANTAHLFVDQLEEAVQLPIIHIAEATATAINNKGLKKVGLMGTKVTMEMDFYKDKLNAQQIEVIIPESEATRDYIQHTLKEELGRGMIKAETKSRYISIMDELIANGAEGIILGCTEIPMMINQADISVPVFDTTKIHVNAAIAFALAE